MYMKISFCRSARSIDSSKMEVHLKKFWVDGAVDTINLKCQINITSNQISQILSGNLEIVDSRTNESGGISTSEKIPFQTSKVIILLCRHQSIDRMDKQQTIVASKGVEGNGLKKEVPGDKSKKGLTSIRAIIFLLLWYFFSGCTLFLNKYILTYQNGNPTVLGACQMLMTATCGFIQLYFPCGMYKPFQRLSKPPGFYRHMVLVGCFRFTTVVLGLVSLNYVAVSFTETIKSSAPLFTVLISRCLLGEQTGLYVNLSLLPVMSGLALCSINEVSFDMTGFVAAMATNVTECVQNVYSKMLISGDKFKYTPAELQFYTSVASIVFQIPATLLMVDLTNSNMIEYKLVLCFILNGIFFHFQSITAYVLMDFISPVTHSVANTAKRAFLIWLSIVMFGNPITVLSGLGTITVIAGVMLYIKAQEYDNNDKMSSANLIHRKVRAI